MGVIGETPLVAVDVCGEGLMGDKLVGEVTERDERLSDKVEERSIKFSGIAWPGGWKYPPYGGGSPRDGVDGVDG